MKSQEYKIKGFERIKRALDIFFASFGIAFSLPLWVVVAVLIKLGDGGDIFYRQKRLGKNGSIFSLIKFRTMVMNAENQGAMLRLEKNDNRVTRVGKFLREFHLDELPQFINILKGEMSLVGPRPALPFQKDYYQEWEMARLKVCPGATGLSQVSGGNAIDWDERIKIDVWYVENRSLLLYFKIVFLTVWQMFFKKGIYSKEGTVRGWTRPVPKELDETRANKE